MGYIYAKDEIAKALGENAIIVMDTCVWLDLYTFSPTTIESIVASFEEKKELFWLPYQVYIEFNRHVIKCRNEAVERYKNLKDNICTVLSKVLNDIDGEFNKLKNKGIKDAEDLHTEVISDIKEINDNVKLQIDILNQGYSAEVECITKEKDIVSNIIEDLHDQSDTDGFKVLELATIYEEGEKRFKYKIPPGYTDENKKEKYEDESQFLLRKYGDLILWKEILRKVKCKKVNVIFIENERKSDWWDKNPNNATKIPKVLMEEFQSITLGGSNLYFVDFEEFLFSFGEIVSLPANSVEEITSRLKFQKSVLDYIIENRNSILESALEEYIDAFQYDGPLIQELTDMSFFGGTPEPSEYLEVVKITVKNSLPDYEQEYGFVNIEAEIEIEFNADIVEYVNRDVYHSGTVTIKAEFETILHLAIDFSDTSIGYDKAYEVNDVDVYNVLFKNIETGDFSIDVHFDEDLFRER